MQKHFEDQFPFATTRWTIRWQENLAARRTNLILSFGFQSTTQTPQEKSGNQNVDSLQPN